MNPVLKRYLKIAAILLVPTVFWLLCVLSNISRQENRYIEILMHQQVLAPDGITIIQQDVLESSHIVNDLVNIYIFFLNYATPVILAFSGLFCLIVYYEQKRLNFGFLQALPIKNSSFFNYASSGFIYVAAAFAITGVLLAALMSRSATLLESAGFVLSPAAYLARLFAARFILCISFYSLCMFAQLIIGPPVAAAAAAFGGIFVPKLFFFTADKFLLASGNYEASRLFGNIYMSLAQYADITSDYWRNYSLRFISSSNMSGWLIALLFFAASAAALFIYGRRISCISRPFSGLFICPLLMRACKVIFVLCAACTFANFGPRFMGIDMADSPLLLLLALFIAGAVSGLYLLARLLPVLDN